MVFLQPLDAEGNEIVGLVLGDFDEHGLQDRLDLGLQVQLAFVDVHQFSYYNLQVGLK